jgi:hypothetical protein
MPLPAQLGNARLLGHIVDHLDELPSSSWLWIRAGTSDVDFATECYPVQIDSREVSEEEMVAFEDAAAGAGFMSFLSSDQLAEIIGNLIEQRPDFTRADLGQAIDFYWKRDAFIVLDG